jgi:hypothetical protein
MFREAVRNQDVVDCIDVFPNPFDCIGSSSIIVAKIPTSIESPMLLLLAVDWNT